MDQDTTFAADLAAAKAGDEEAFVRLFRGVQPALLRYLGALAGDDAQDLAAETWLRVVDGLGRFDGDEAGFRSWVFTIARSRRVDALRRAGSRPERPVAEVPDRPGGEDVAATVEEADSTRHALELIAALPPDQAEVLLLRVVAGLDVSATARLLGKSPGAVRVLAHRGLRRLGTLLAGHSLTVV